MITLYTIKIALRGVSPMVWQRLHLSGITSLAQFHHIIQLAMEWDDDNLHHFRIYAKLRYATRTLPAELGVQGTRVNAVAPEPIETPIYSKIGIPEERLNEMAAGIITQVPASRFGKPDEIAAGVVFLASDASSYMRGAGDPS
jgi:hypothetical protein